MAQTTGELSGKRILVVEDEFFLGYLLEEDLKAAGATVLGPMNTLARALESATSETFDVAILDVNLSGQMIYPAADKLRERGVPFMFLSGYGWADFPERFRETPRVAKPYELKVLMQVLLKTLASST